jgi:hypothetical protein
LRTVVAPAEAMDLSDIRAAREHTEQLLRGSNERALTFCILDLELALSLLDRADTSSNPGIAGRNRQNAWHAGFIVQRQLSHLILDEAHVERIKRLLSQLRPRLQRLGLPLRADTGCCRSSAAARPADDSAPSANAAAPVSRVQPTPAASKNCCANLNGSAGVTTSSYEPA